jgi:hypothetical protein
MSKFVTTGMYRQSVRLGVRPLEAHDERFFFQVNSFGKSLYVTSSLTRRWVCLLWIRLAFRQVYVSHIQHVIANSSFCTAHKSSVSQEYVDLHVKITPRHGPRRKHPLLLLCLPRRCIATVAARTTKKKSFFYCCRRYVATAAVYRVTA